MESHTAKERKLKADIIQKNSLSKKLQKHLSAIRRWTEELNKTHRLRRQRKLKASITRYQEQVVRLRDELLRRCDTLETRIKKEMAYSEEEVKAFKTRLTKDVKALQKTQQNLEETEKDKTASKADPAIKPRLEKLLKEEFQKVKKDEKALKSEERDKALFTLELKRMALERKLYGS